MKTLKIIGKIFLWILGYAVINTAIKMANRHNELYIYYFGIFIIGMIITCIIYRNSILRFFQRAILWVQSHPKPKRLFIWGTTLWTVFVPLFVWIAEPFGGYMGDDEWVSFCKLLFIPPIAIIVGYWSYKKLVDVED
jgi:hypothetical protein